MDEQLHILFFPLSTFPCAWGNATGGHALETLAKTTHKLGDFGLLRNFSKSSLLIYRLQVIIIMMLHGVNVRIIQDDAYEILGILYVLKTC